jgi:sirohydrochlorin ferrochelatase
MKTVVVLAVHGMPPSDFPETDRAEFFRLRTALGARRSADAQERAQMEARLAELDRKMRGWPRNPQNDSFHEYSESLAKQLSEQTHLEVRTGYNEFCNPTLKDAIESAIAEGAGKVIIVTPMMTRGGSHAEREIPDEIKEIQAQHPGVQLVYGWPFDTASITSFLADQIRRFQ